MRKAVALSFTAVGICVAQQSLADGSDSTPAPTGDGIGCCTDLRQILALIFGCGWVVVGSAIVYMCLIRPGLWRRLMNSSRSDAPGVALGNSRGNSGTSDPASNLLVHTLRRRFQLIQIDLWDGNEGAILRAEGWLLASSKVAEDAWELLQTDVALPSENHPLDPRADEPRSVLALLEDGVAQLTEDATEAHPSPGSPPWPTAPPPAPLHADADADAAPESEPANPTPPKAEVDPRLTARAEIERMLAEAERPAQSGGGGILGTLARWAGLR
mmetsp:Transcript_55696/g.147113  ORF Transcript_55696/g.147113 Transcript_55696/m.147113 type:complete len:272 (+) Transcript_55696:48-863(+)